MLIDGEENILISSENVNGRRGGRGALVFVVVFAENGGGLETSAGDGGSGARDCGAGFSTGAGGVEEIRSMTSGILFFCTMRSGGGGGRLRFYFLEFWNAS